MVWSVSAYRRVYLLQLGIECDAYNAVNNYSIWTALVLAGKRRAQAHTLPITQTRTAFRRKEKLLLWHSLDTSGFICHFPINYPISVAVKYTWIVPNF